MRHPLLPTLALALVSQVPVIALAGAPSTPRPLIAYQGRLLEGTLPVTGLRTFTFSILDSSSAVLWSSGDRSISVNNGLYAVVLGASPMPEIPASLLAMSGLKLHVTVGGTALTPDTDLVPALQARSAFEVTGEFAGDVEGTQSAMSVKKIAGFPVDLSTSAPGSGESLVFDGTNWVPRTVTGVQGPVGPQGPMGPTGPVGAIGPQGLQGIQGVQGVTGAVGPIGPTGATGSSISFKGAWSASTTYAIGEAVAEGGTSYIALTANTGVTPSADVAGSGGHWAVMAAQGATGAVGPTGPQGIQGPQGLQGIQGIQGVQGVTGAQGPVGPTGATGSPIAFKGTWNGTADYVIGDAVYESGTSYIALAANKSVDPAMDVAGGGTSWAVLALQGATGAAGGGVSIVTADAPLSVTDGGSTPKISLTGTLPDAVFPATLPALSGANLTSLNASNLSSGTLAAARMPALTGDISSSSGSTSATVTKLQGVALAATAPSSGQVLAYNGAAWAPAAASAGTVTSITAGTGLSGGTITGSGTISITSPYVTVTAGSGLTGGGTVGLGGSVTISDNRFGVTTYNAVAGRGSEKALGEVWLVAGTVSGGTPCDGRTLTIQSNTALFALLGTLYGGNGVTTFALPDLRGVAPKGLTYVIATEGLFPSRLD